MAGLLLRLKWTDLSERDHVWWQLVPSCDVPLADQLDLEVVVGWLSFPGHAWLDSGQHHSHTPLWGS